MNSRARDLMLLLMENDQFFTINELSDHFSVSERTIYNDLMEIDDFFNKHSFSPLQRQKGVGIRVELHKLEQQKVKELLDLEEFSYHTPEERKYHALHYLLIQHGYVTIDQLSNFLKVSRNTVINDMKLWKKWLISHQLSLMSYPYKGLKIEGTELAIRKALLALFREEKRNRIQISNTKQSILHEFLSSEDIDHLIHIIGMAERELQIIISDHSYFRVMLHLGLAITRVKQEKMLEKGAAADSVRETREYEVACFLKEEIDRLFHINFPENEVLYFAAQLVSSSLQDAKQYGNINDQWLPLQMVTREFIRQLEESFQMPLMKDAQLFNGLLAHLRPALYRIRNGTTIANPVLDEIKENYSYIHQHVLKAIHVIEMKLSIVFNEDEASFITMYVTAALERQKKSIRRKPVVIIVCDTGMSTSQMLATQLKNLFHLRVFGSFPARQANEIVQTELIDLVITTVPLEMNETQVVTVNPVLSKEDIQKLTLMLEKLEGEELLVLDILHIIYPYCTIHDPVALHNKLQNYFQHDATNLPKIERSTNPVLIEVLNEKLIMTQAELKDRDSAVRCSGEILLKNNLIEQTYIQAMIDNVHENGTYIVIAPGIAMPHARPEYGAKDIGFSIVTLKEPIEFGHRTNDPVKIVIGFCAIDHETHLTALSELVGVLNQEDKLAAILNAKTPKEIMKIFQREGKQC
ncbi:BglG family transcription antiterminator [Cerasibacillus sp. JNUCC 74]